VTAATEAVLAAARHVATPDADARTADDARGMPDVDITGFAPKVLAESSGMERATTLEAGPFGDEITASLVWFDGRDGLALAWDVRLPFAHHLALYTTLVDAGSGEILYCRQLVNRAVGEGNVSRGSGLPRQMTRFPRELDTYGFPPDGTLPAAFPDDWVGSVATAGNATNAGYMNGNVLTALQGEVQNDLVIFDPSDQPIDVNNRGILNLFYYTCFMHDFFYLLGFREKDGNFQQDNFGRGGKDKDGLNAVYWPGQFPPLPNTFPEEGAAMYTPVDGKPPTMNVSLIVSTGRHTAFDSTIIFHEFMHGVTSRLVGGPDVGGTLIEPQSDGMSEGWSDYVACVLNNTSVFASWVADNPMGIRPFPYTPDYPMDFGSLSMPSNQDSYLVGGVWCAAMINTTLQIGDSIAALQLSVDALKLVRANPSFLDMRDALLWALEDMLAAGRITQAQHDTWLQAIWSTFARFGMGVYAACNGAQLDGIVADYSASPRAVVRGAGVTSDSTCAFVLGSSGHLWTTWHDGAVPHWTDISANAGAPGRVLGGVGASGDGTAVYVLSDTGQLWQATGSRNGAWTWANASAAPTAAGVRLVCGVGVQADGTGVFAIDGNGHLWRATREGTAWTWADVSAAKPGGPPPTFVRGVGVSGDGRTVFAISNDIHLWQVALDASAAWQWTDVSAAGPTINYMSNDLPGLAVQADGSSAFVADGRGHLWQARRSANAWQWQWSDAGAPPQVLNWPGGAASADGTVAFAGSMTYAYRYARNAQSAWTSANLNLQSAAPPPSMRLSAVVGGSADGNTVFILSDDGHLRQVTWNAGSSQAVWQDWGVPPS
jgi:extracellular elastinolytic metalloproteinase